MTMRGVLQRTGCWQSTAQSVAQCANVSYAQNAQARAQSGQGAPALSSQDLSHNGAFEQVVHHDRL